VGDNGALGSGELVIPNNSSMGLAPGITITNAMLAQGYGAEKNGTPCGAISFSSNGIAAYNGKIGLSGDCGFRASSPGSILSIGGTISGSANLTLMAGAGTIVLTTNQLYSGKTFVQGRLQLAGGINTLPTTADVCLADSNGAQLDLNDNDQELGSISGGGIYGGRILLGRANLRIAPVTRTCYSGSISGTGTLEKVGSGSLILAGTNDYSGKTFIREGTLEVSGSLRGTSVEVNGGALTGNGSIEGPVTVADGSVLKLSIAPDPLTVGNQLLLSPASITRVELDPARGVCGRVQGMTSVSYAGFLVVSNVTFGTNFTSGQSFQLFSSAVAEGSFARVEPDPGPGLVWRFDVKRGILTAVARPRMQMLWADAKAKVISWQGEGFHVQALTNYAGLNTSNCWYDYPGGQTSPVMVPIDVRQPEVFFRLVSP